MSVQHKGMSIHVPGRDKICGMCVAFTQIEMHENQDTGNINQIIGINNNTQSVFYFFNLIKF